MYLCVHHPYTTLSFLMKIKYAEDIIIELRNI